MSEKEEKGLDEKQKQRSEILGEKIMNTKQKKQNEIIQTMKEIK